ncbi:uncharacterized protein M421DRAFT_322662 [Didymella exigua CBS 183.55]|uniref:Uncharacterized protein n=1 Tax=Didymella exigua CBS 183.55 TaxID=1150837 RepID=A0A6A5RTX5_9PLEO|nr:uncharacterized protein M421DRAFT_322662 [Didymella exigua CBS 183.55]KAF1931881.1 hypothetical protein M421DRAFT_322662 [Didymella exigua CBS 183.55]
MKTLTNLLAVAGLICLTAAAPSPALIQGSCGVCDTFPNGAIGGSAQIALRSSTDHVKGRAYKCTTFDSEVRLNTCVNQQCGLCMIFKHNDCQGEVLFWGGSGTEFRGQGARSYFCM